VYASHGLILHTGFCLAIRKLSVIGTRLARYFLRDSGDRLENRARVLIMFWQSRFTKNPLVICLTKHMTIHSDIAAVVASGLRRRSTPRYAEALT